MIKKFIFPVSPIPKVRTTQGAKWSPAAQRCAAYQNTIAKLAMYFRLKFKNQDIWFEECSFYRHGARRADLDNLLKSFLDGLQYGKAIENDNQLVHIKNLGVYYSSNVPQIILKVDEAVLESYDEIKTNLCEIYPQRFMRQFYYFDPYSKFSRVMEKNLQKPPVLG